MHFHSIVKNSVFFSCYETLKIAMPSSSPLRQMLFGVVSGCVTTIFVLPLQVFTVSVFASLFFLKEKQIVQTLQNVHSNRGARMSGILFSCLIVFVCL